MLNTERSDNMLGANMGETTINENSVLQIF